MELRGYQQVDLSIHLPGHEGFGHTPNPFNGNNSIRPKDKSTRARGNIPFRGDMQKTPTSWVIVVFGGACRSLVFLARRLKPCGRFGRKGRVEEVDLPLSDNGVLRDLQRRD